ncbi:Flp pilus assembly protein CpaB [Paenibacillus sp. GP183]|uniref:Flp pilus assembly protein CpaB n=1 Tax=Paenibacillus sp. GP183 TaxID=1882751 RepID=UPI000898D1C9|nr:Flp pilus assembly protein CpaB [Paenibacillus sp. GP183]SEC17521.1 pilus assembly protein CpaB [Paenibacillus sp. GP183]
MRSKIILVMALLMGLVTTVLFFNYMKKFDQVKAADASVVTVIGAKQAIKANTKITPEMLQTMQVPAALVHPQAVRNSTDAVDKIAVMDMAPDEILLSHHLKNQVEEALFVSKKVQEGYRAVTVGVNLVQSVSNLIEPGDYVDVVSTLTDKLSDKVISTTINQNLRVLAIGRRMVEAKSDTPYAEYSTVTLEAKPEDSVTLINANGRGSINLLLRSRINAASDKK